MSAVSPRSLLSIDLPWSSDGWVGAAVAREEQGVHRVSVAVVPSRGMPLPKNLPDCDDFVRHGARGDARLAADATPPDPEINEGARRLYLESLYGAFHDLSRILGLESLQVAAIDMPLVPASLVAGLSLPSGKLSTRRPVEKAFEKKVRFAGDDWHFDFSNPQSGIYVGWRPGYAAAELVAALWKPVSIAESFPQLSIGALQEMPDATAAPITSLAAHKGALAKSRSGREVVYQRICAWLGHEPRWLCGGLHERGAADALDAMLGLLPLIALDAETDDDSARHRRPVLLRNLRYGEADLPSKSGPRGMKVVSGCRAWIDAAPALAPGVNDSGILALDLVGWR